MSIQLGEKFLWTFKSLGAYKEGKKFLDIHYESD